MSEKSCNNCLHQKVCLDFGLITCERFENKDEWVHLLCKPRTRIYALGYSKRGYKHLIMNGEVYSVSINDRGTFYAVSTSTDVFMFEDKEFGQTVFLTKAEAEEAIERMNTKNR